MIRIVDISSEAQARAAVGRTGADPYAVPLMARKACMRAVEISDADNRAANVLKQEMLAIGAEAAVSHVVSRFEKGRSRVLLLGTLRQFERLIPRLAAQPFGLPQIAQEISQALLQYDVASFSLKAGKGRLALGTTPVLMGILNITPDSFSDGGAYRDVASAVAHGCEMVRHGAGSIDVGGESTRPGARMVSAKEERARVIPVIRSLARQITVPISIDTYKPDVAAAALDAGATIINDITALRFERGAMARLAARRKVPVVLMHMRGTPRTMQKHPAYTDVVADIGAFFQERLACAAERGIDPAQTILDPGIGFGKTTAHNLEILRRLKEFRICGRPLLVGMSNKRFIGEITGRQLPAERLHGSIAGELWAAQQGAHVLRVHDVAATAEALKMLSAIRDNDDHVA